SEQLMCVGPLTSSVVDRARAISSLERPNLLRSCSKLVFDMVFPRSFEVGEASASKLSLSGGVVEDSAGVHGFACGQSWTTRAWPAVESGEAAGVLLTVLITVAEPVVPGRPPCPPAPRMVPGPPRPPAPARPAMPTE